LSALQSYTIGPTKLVKIRAVQVFATLIVFWKVYILNYCA